VVYELAPETLMPGQNVPVGVFSMEPVTVISGTIGAYKLKHPLIFPERFQYVMVQIQLIA